MYICTIKDLEEVAKIYEEYTGQDVFMWVRNQFYKDDKILFRFDTNMIISYQRITPDIWTIHLVGYTNKLKGLKKELIQIGSYLIDKYNCKSIICFCDATQIQLQRFIGYVGGIRIGNIPKENGADLIYSFPFSLRDEVD